MIRSAIKSGLQRVLGGNVKPAPAASPPPPPPAWKYPEAVAKAEPSAPSVDAAPAEAPPSPAVVAAAATEPIAVDAAPVASPGEAVSAPAPAQDVIGPLLTLEAVQEIMDEMVRPALQGDGGDITLLRVEDNDVYVKLVGSCSTCPSSIMTMKMGVEALLKEEFPVMRSLIQVD